MKKNFIKTNLSIKSNLASGQISGYGSIFNIRDFHQDIVKPGAFLESIEQFKRNPKSIKLLWQHNYEEPIGYFTDLKEDEKGLYFEAQLLLELTRAKEAYSLIEAGVIDSLSIGFSIIDQYIDHASKSKILTKLDLIEISLVTFPANPQSKITNIKGENNMKDNHNQLMHTFEEFKQENNLNSSDPIHMEKLSRINEEIERLDNKIKSYEIAINRPKLGAKATNHNPHRQAFTEYLRKGIENHLGEMERKYLNTAISSDGGYLVNSEMSDYIIRNITESSSMRKLASSETISTNNLELIEDLDTLESGWTSETGPIVDTGTPTLGKKTISVHELYAQPKATQQLIDDASIDIEKWLGQKLVEQFSVMENHSFIHGDGNGKPRGILDYEDGQHWGSIEQIKTENSITAESLYSLYYSLAENYSQKASFLMHRSTLMQIRMLKDPITGHYLWNPGLEAGSPSTLLGAPVYQCQEMPVISDDAICVALADFASAYKIVDRTGVRTLRDPYTDKPFVKFYTTKRVGGDVVNYKAIKLLKIRA